MIFLVASILCSTIIGILFDQFERFEVDNFQAIVFNYLVCVVCATLTLGHSPATPQFWQEAWFPYAILLGGIFISIFTMVAITIQKFGITVGVIVQKMSIIVSVSFALLYYGESSSTLKIVGILLALLAIVLTNIRQSSEQKETLPFYLWLYPFLVFFGAGIGEIILQYVETRLTSGNGNLQFVGFLFGTAGSIGFLILMGKLLLRKTQFAWKNVVAGILLGIPNFGSIYFLMKALGFGWEGSVIFPVNNVGIIILSALLAVLFFNEKLNTWNIIGVGLATLSIIMIAL